MSSVLKNEVVIEVDSLSKDFKLPINKANTLKSTIVHLNRFGKSNFVQQKALDNVSFEVHKSEFFGIVGRNGSGKSTLLKILAGIYSPTSGNVRVSGKLVPFIELGVGFSPELTGRENVFLNGALLGFSRQQMLDLYDDIVDFADIGRFMNQKLKNYSSGMQVRLAFSIAIRVRSDILLIDEVLAVGDSAFQSKCFDYFDELKKSDTTVVFVSHDRSSLDRFCDNGILINDGQVKQRGAIKKVLYAYDDIIMGQLDKINNKSADESNSLSTTNKREVANIVSLKTYHEIDKPTNKFNYNKDIFVSFKVKFNEDVLNPVFNIKLWKKNIDRPIFFNSTSLEKIINTGKFKNKDSINVTVSLPKNINDGEFYIEANVYNDSSTLLLATKKSSTLYISGSLNTESIISSTSKIILER